MDHLEVSMESYKTLKVKAIALAKDHAAKISLSILTALALLIAIVLRNYFNGFRLGLEELLGIVAVTTFLVGFASVRLQSNQEHWKESASRLINRVLEQNANDDLLPLPTSFSQYKTDTEEFVPRDNAARITSVLTWSTFGISSYLIYMHWLNYGKVAELLLIQIIHLAIAVTTSVEPYFAKRYSKKYTKRQPFQRYEELSEALVDYLTDEENENEIEIKKKRVREAVDGLDESLPSWCWLYLIRCHIDPADVKTLYSPQLQRLRELAKKSKHFDDFSNIVFVWSTYLLEEKEASISIRYTDIQRIMKFSTDTARRKFLPGQTVCQRQISYGGDIYAEMTLRCVYRSWTGTETLEEPLKKLAETDQSPLSVLGNHLKKIKDDRVYVQVWFPFAELWREKNLGQKSK